MPTPLIIDTDPGCDDAVALMFLAKAPQVSILGITTVAGNSTIENTTRNTRYLLGLMQITGIPIHSGAAKPLFRPLVLSAVNGESGLEGVDTSQIEPALTGDGEQFIIDSVRAQPGEVEILALGPLTNLAHAFQKDPELPLLLKRVVIMGGAINVPGNKSRVAEFNFFVDPEAAAIVIQAPIEKILLPLDICNQVALSKEELENLGNNQAAQAAAAFLKPYFEKIKIEDGLDGAIMYDPLAAYYTLVPEAFTLTPMDIFIETKGEHTAGMIVIEQRLARPVHPNVQVVTAVDQEGFHRDLHRALTALP